VAGRTGDGFAATAPRADAVIGRRRPTRRRIDAAGAAPDAASTGAFVMTAEAPYPHLLRQADIAARAMTFRHPWNPNSEITGTWMGRLAGLARTGVSVGRIAPGRGSFAYHLHHTEEEWIYVLSGRGVARIDGRDYELAAGDFVAFPTPSVAHNMANPYAEELVYLMGGEHRADEVADFPLLDRRMVKLGGKLSIYRLSDGEPFPAAGE
jgi:uncharacterized cupin superfamily protein